MGPQVRSLGLDSAEDGFYRLWLTIALADRAYAYPHARCEAIAIGSDVFDILLRLIPLQNGHDVNMRWDSGSDAVVTLDGERLVLFDGETSLLQNKRFCHVVLT